MQLADNGEVDLAVVVDEILLHGAVHSTRVTTAAGRHIGEEVERTRRLLVGRYDGDGEQVLRHDTSIVQTS